jgi:hypothetical protein
VIVAGRVGIESSSAKEEIEMPTVEEIIKEQVSLEISCVDRVYLNGYIPCLMQPGQVVNFLRKHLGFQIPSPAVLQRIHDDFVKRVEAFAKAEDIPVVQFEKGRKKDDVAAWYRARFKKEEGVVFIGIAQEKAKAWRARKEKKGKWIHFEYSRQSVCVNHYYFYIQDRQFGPTFIRVCSYAPWGMKLCLNGHEWAKCQARRQGLRFESLDNGFLSCTDAEWLQRICDRLDDGHIQVMWNRWLSRLPLPLGKKDFEAGYYPQLSIWQMEMSLTDVFKRPVQGREFFEQVIRSNLDLGRPDRVQLVFDRRVNRRTPSRYRTRVIEHGVAPSLHVEYKTFRREAVLQRRTCAPDGNDRQRYLRFGINRGLKNFDRLRTRGKQTNRRLLQAEQVEGGSAFASATFQALVRPTTTTDGRPAPALKFGDERVLAVFSAVGSFQHLVDGFTNAALRKRVAALLGVALEQYTSAQMTYDLRRLAAKGLLRRFRGRHRYLLTESGRRVICTLLKTYRLIVRTSFPSWSAQPVPPHLRDEVTAAFDALDRAFADLARDAGLRGAA